MRIFHDSRNEKYRSPGFALPVGTKVRLALCVTETENAKCTLLVWSDGEDISRIGMEKNTDGLYSASVTAPGHGCLLWYAFEVCDGERTVFFGNNGERLGGVGCEYTTDPVPFQITVYVPEKTPEWYKNSVVYQIFPDRFARGKDWLECQAASVNERAGRPGPKRLLQTDWDDSPIYLRDEQGGIARWTFSGGTLSGITEKLGYLQSLGVTCIYLNPIFLAQSNHRYDTEDYMRVDTALGGDAAFRELCDAAHECGIRIILDGVFSHTGSDSVYFDEHGVYGSGAVSGGENSPYYDWYKFSRFPDEYDSWWGVKALPEVKELSPSYVEFICGENGVVRHWLREGADGWRLDVADELPDEFIRAVRRAVEEEKPDAVLIGEVWEDASNKISYGARRQYLTGGELHSVMHYPFRSEAIPFFLGYSDAYRFASAMSSILENYPPESLYGTLCLIGSHDRARILSVLGGAPEELPERERESFRLSDLEREKAKKRLAALSVIQFCMPGAPCIYYGDEAGVEGLTDPYNRGTYPWGREDTELTSHYRAISALRHGHDALRCGAVRYAALSEDVFAVIRENGSERIAAIANRSDNSVTVQLPEGFENAEVLFGEYDGTFAPLSAVVLRS